jgi:hypothetical protein
MQMTREAEIAPQRIPDPAQGSKPLLQPPAAATNGKRKTDTEEVGKGCGCIVM